jgi:hypothetical protein
VHCTVAVYTGTSLTNLTVLASNALGANLVFTAPERQRLYLALDLSDNGAGAGLSPLLLEFMLVQQPLILTPTLGADSTLTFRIVGPSGQSVLLQRSTDLNNWELVRTISLGSAEFRFQELLMPSVTNRFYRVLSNSP